MTKYLLLLILLTSCHPETILPTCEGVEAVQIGQKVKLKIYSDQPKVSICIDERCFDVSAHYYKCVSFSVEVGQIVTINHECEILIK
jgi:hypothetical protein